MIPVRDKMMAEAQLFLDMINESNALVYIARAAAEMPIGARQVIVDIYRSAGGLIVELGETYVKPMEAEGRFLQHRIRAYRWLLIVPYQFCFQIRALVAHQYLLHISRHPPIQSTDYNYLSVGTTGYGKKARRQIL